MRLVVMSVIIGSLFWGMGSPVAACTLFAANGTAWVQGGGSLIVKNRDWRPEGQEMRLVTNGKYKYYGLYAGGEGQRQLKGGVNERGLAVFSASASSIPAKERRAMPQAKKSALRTMLAECASVEEALAHTELYIGPKFLLLADAQKIAYVEIAPEGKYQIRIQENATLAHTNHYLETGLSDANERIGQSSRTRYTRIMELLQNGKQPYGLEDFIHFSEDRQAGPDDSIWRTGSRSGSEQTLATLAVHLQAGQAPEIYVKIRYVPEDQGKEDCFIIDGAELFRETVQN